MYSLGTYWNLFIRDVARVTPLLGYIFKTCNRVQTEYCGVWNALYCFESASKKSNNKSCILILSRVSCIVWSDQFEKSNHGWVTQWGPDKIAAISQTTFSNAFSCMKMYVFCLRFHWSLFLRFVLTELVQIMAWCRPGKTPLSGPMPVSLLTYIVCVARAQCDKVCNHLGAVSIRKTVLPGMAIPMLKIRRPNGRLIFNMKIAIRR